MSTTIRDAGKITSESLRTMYDHHVVQLNEAVAEVNVIADKAANTEDGKLAKKLAIAQALVSKLETECNILQCRANTAKRRHRRRVSVAEPKPLTDVNASFDQECAV